jgi:hypothetical protein
MPPAIKSTFEQGSSVVWFAVILRLSLQEKLICLDFSNKDNKQRTTGQARFAYSSGSMLNKESVCLKRRLGI